MISPKHNTLFVHIPKVAGQSVETLFLEDLGLDWNKRGELLLRIKKPEEKGPYRLAHLTATDYVRLGYVDADTFDAFFTFSFVRNPYARALSFYHYLGYSRIIDFSTFVDKVLSRKIKEGHFFFMPQYGYIYDENGRCMVDFVGKLERISEDMKQVMKRSGITGRSLPHVNKSEKGLKRGIAALVKSPSLWPHLKPGRIFSNKKQKELSPVEKEKVVQLYPKDFEYFDYER